MYIGNKIEKYADIVGPKDNIIIHPTVGIAGSEYKLHINVSSGKVKIGMFTFFGAGVMLLAGSHDYKLLGNDRQDFWYKEGYDIEIGEGVWIASGVTILGPCKIGDNSVIGAGSLVTKDIPEGEVWFGSPAIFIKKI